MRNNSNVVSSFAVPSPCSWHESQILRITTSIGSVVSLASRAEITPLVPNISSSLFIDSITPSENNANTSSPRKENSLEE